MLNFNIFYVLFIVIVSICFFLNKYYNKEIKICYECFKDLYYEIDEHILVMMTNDD